MKYVVKIAVLSSLLFFVTTCDDQSNFFTEDWRNAPEPYDVTGITPTVRPNGLIIYEIQEGTGLFEIMERDVVVAEYTGRTRNGRVFFSTYTRGGTTTIDYNLNTRSPEGYVVPNEGFRDGVVGMRTGGIRRLVIPPALGYGGRPGNNLANDTLFYDVKINALLTE